VQTSQEAQRRAPVRSSLCRPAGLRLAAAGA